LPTEKTMCPDCGEDLAALMRLQLEPYVLYNEGLRLATAGDLDWAILKMHQAAAALPDEPSTCIVLGKLYARRGDWDNARQWWNKTLERWPEEETARKGLATLEARAAAAQASRQQEQARQHRQRWISALLYASLGGLLVGLVAIGVSTFRPMAAPLSSATQIAAASLTPVPSQTPTIPLPTPTVPLPTATTAAPTPVPTPVPTLPPSPTPVSTPDLVGPIQTTIRADPRLSGLRIQVRQEGLAVWLEGEVPTVGVKYQLEALAKRVPGIKLVDVSGLRVIYTVQKGDTLSEISEAMYDQSELWPLIAATNQLVNPQLIHPGNVLVIPPPR